MRRRSLTGGEALQIKIAKFTQRYNLFSLNRHKNKNKRKLPMLLLKNGTRRTFILSPNNINRLKKFMNSLSLLPKIESLISGWTLRERGKRQLREAWSRISGSSPRKSESIFLARRREGNPAQGSMTRKPRWSLFGNRWLWALTRNKTNLIALIISFAVSRRIT